MTGIRSLWIIYLTIMHKVVEGDCDMSTMMQKMMGMIHSPMMPAAIRMLSKEGVQRKGWLKAGAKIAGISQFVKGFSFPHMVRVMAGMGAWPTNVPIYAQLNELIPKLCGVPFDYLFRDDPVAMAECSLLVWEYADLDVITLNLDGYNFEAESTGAKLNFYPDHAPDIDRASLLIKDENDLDKIKWNGMSSGRFPYIKQYCEEFNGYVGFMPPLCFSAPWTLASNLYGLENLVMGTIEDPEFVHELLRRIVEDLEIPMLKDLVKDVPGLLIISFADAMASSPMVSPDILTEYVEPYYMKVHAALKELLPNAIVNNSGIFGSSTLRGEGKKQFIDSTIRMAGQLFVFDPDVAKDSPEYYVDYANSYGCPILIGMSQNVLEQESPEEVAQYAKQYVLAGKKSKLPYTFFFSNISPNTPVENIAAAVKAVKVYGKPGADGSEEYELPKTMSFEEFLKKKQADNVEGYTFRWLEKRV